MREKEWYREPDFVFLKDEIGFLILNFLQGAGAARNKRRLNGKDEEKAMKNFEKYTKQFFLPPV